MTTRDHIIVSEGSIEIIEVGGGGAPRPSAGTFILDVTSNGVVGARVRASESLVSCSADTALVTVHVGCEGDAQSYIPTATVNGVDAPLTESSTRRWFLGSAQIPLLAGPNKITALSSTGTTSSAVITRLAAGPSVASVVFGAYPGTQTELKQGDSINVTINTEPEATQVTLSGGAVVGSQTLAVNAGVASGVLVVGSASGTVSFSVAARNAFGTVGDTFTAPPLVLNQTYPTFGAFAVTYPAGQGALGTDQSASVSCAVTGADSVTYDAVGLSVAPGYLTTKTVTNTSSGYVSSGSNYTVSATRAANNATASASTLVKLATVAPSAAISIAGAPLRLASSPTGIDYEVRITPDQTLAGAPTVLASHGTWLGSWTLIGGYWRRSLRIADADARGAASFSGLVLTGLALLPGSTLSAGASYIVGGLALRTLTFAAFARVTALGAAVGDRSKTSATVVGGNALTRYDDNAVRANGFYIAAADGSYDPQGAYLGVSDTGLVGANTSGTLQVSFQEAA